MRDVIWTLIGIWFVYRIYLFFTENHKKNNSNTSYRRDSEPDSPNRYQPRTSDTEYIDFEEIKDQ